MSRTARRLAGAALLAGLALAGPAPAHPGHDAGSLAAGLAHPLGGVDHLLAMTAVGLLAARRGGAALLAWPGAFLAAMLAGYGLGGVWPGLAPMVEPAVLASVMVLGALAAAAPRTPFAAGLAVIALSGACHGYAHGGEAPANAALAFPLGFLLSTAALHAAGLGAGLALPVRLTRLAGVLVLAGGAALAVAG